MEKKYDISEFRYEYYENTSPDFFMKITHIPTGVSVTNSGLNIKSRYKTKTVLMGKILEKL